MNRDTDRSGHLTEEEIDRLQATARRLLDSTSPYEIRVREAQRAMASGNYPLDGPLSAYPEEIRHHGVIVCRDAAWRLQNARKAIRSWCEMLPFELNRMDWQKRNKKKQLTRKTNKL